MSKELIFLGGSEEIGANSCYVYLDGTGIIIDAGLHPKDRGSGAFPRCEFISEKPADLLILSHAHTDHIGGIPFVLKHHPHLRLLTTRATRDLAGIMLRDTAKLIKTDLVSEFNPGTLSLYEPEILEKISMIIEGYRYNEPQSLRGRAGLSDVKITFYPSGHILGSASILLESAGFSLLHTSDVNFAGQNLLPRADLPEHHVDCLIIESTNAAEESPKNYDNEKKRLASFINKIANNNGSILIPAFALGKTQEVLKIIYDLMRKGSIPSLPIYTSGLGRKISGVYDRYCYSVPRIEPGFELADIPQKIIIYDEIYTGKYFKEASIVLVSSGMMNKGTISFNLGSRWFMKAGFGIAIVGYQEKGVPGFELLHSDKDSEFVWGGKKTKRACELENFRFTSHATLQGLLDYINKVKPKQLYIVHGESEASGNLALHVNENLPQTGIHIPKIGKEYKI